MAVAGAVRDFMIVSRDPRPAPESLAFMFTAAVMAPAAPDGFAQASINFPASRKIR